MNVSLLTLRYGILVYGVCYFIIFSKVLFLIIVKTQAIEFLPRFGFLQFTSSVLLVADFVVCLQLTV